MNIWGKNFEKEGVRSEALSWKEFDTQNIQLLKTQRKQFTLSLREGGGFLPIGESIRGKRGRDLDPETWVREKVFP